MNKYNFLIDSYNISIDIDANNLKYTGNNLINLLILNDITSIKIDCAEIKILSIKINCIVIDNNKWKKNKQDEYIEIYYNFVNKQSYQINFEFENSIGKEMDGFYYYISNNDLILCTNFEPTSARKFIPCFDKPDLKAKFILDVTIDSKYNVISNSSLKKTILSNGKKKYYFNPTPIMSTYLLCIVAGDIFKNSLMQIYDNITINGYSTKSNIDKISWSITHTKKALEFFTNWFNIKYPLEKLDIVSIPNFSSGAMENWGLITFRDEYILLCDTNNYFSKIKILEVIYHEISHQWFGNLVTMDNWNSLWLNESTATFFSWMALDINYPDYMINELYWLMEYKHILISDGMTNTHPIVISSNDNINSNDNIEPIELFDEITYTKGNVIIRYIANLMGLDNFKKSIRKYLIDNMYSNSKTSQLTQSFNKYSSNKKINWQLLMNNLIKTKGFPILYVEKNNNIWKIKYFTFNLDKSLECEYPHEIFIKIKYFKSNLKNDFEEILIELKPNCDNFLPTYLTNNKFIINPSNMLFCICKYDKIIPDLEFMNNDELLKYFHDEFILYLHGYTKLSHYLSLILLGFVIVDLKQKYLFLYLIIADLIELLQISKITNINLSNKIINFIMKNLRKKYIKALKYILESKPKYYQMVIDKIFQLELELDKNIKTQLNITKLKNLIYQYYIKIICENKNDFNCSFEKTLFIGIMKYYQDTQIKNILNILANTSNPSIYSSIIESFSMLSDNNFNVIFSNYKNLIKTQHYRIFFWSISKITSKQNFIIEYWMNCRNEISEIIDIQYDILKNIVSNIYESDLIHKISNYICKNYSSKYKFILNKIIDILNVNKLICDNFNRK